MIWRSSGRLMQRARPGVERRVEREPEREEHEERDQQAGRQPAERRRRVLDVEDRVADPSRQQQRDDRGREHEAHLGEPGEADAADLADDELRRGRRGDQQLHHAVRLLGDDAGRDPQAVEHEGQERQHHEHDADDPPARVLRRVDGDAAAGAGGRRGVDDGERRRARTACRRAAATDVQSMTPTPNAPICRSWARSGLRAPALTTLKSRPASGLRSMMIAPASVPLLTFSVAVCASATTSNVNVPLGGGVRGQRRVEEGVEGLDGALGEGRVRRRDPDPRHGRPVEQPHAERDQRHDDREAHQQQRREQEGAGLHALDVLAARDEPDVDRRGAHAASSPDAVTAGARRLGGAARRARRGPPAVRRQEVRHLVHGPPDEVDEHLLEARIGELEVRDARAGADRRREDDVRLDALLELDRRAVHPDLDDPGARAPPRATPADGRPRPRSGPSAARSSDGPRAACRRPPCGRDRRSRPTRTGPRRPPSGASRRRRCGRGRGARGTPRAGASR